MSTEERTTEKSSADWVEWLRGDIPVSIGIRGLVIGLQAMSPPRLSSLMGYCYGLDDADTGTKSEEQVFRIEVFCVSICALV